MYPGFAVCACIWLAAGLSLFSPALPALAETGRHSGGGAVDCPRQPRLDASAGDQTAPYFIVGAVSRPGAYPFRPGLTVRNAALLAGGLTHRSDEVFLGISRSGGGSRAEIEASICTFVQPGDVIRVEERLF